MSAVFYLLLGWGLAVSGCYAAGALLLARLGTRFSREEIHAMRFVAGAGLYATFVFFLGIAHLYYRPVFAGAPLVLMLAAWRSGALTMPAERLPGLPVLWRRMAWIAAPFAVLYLANAMAPEASPDGTAYHLGLVSKYYRERAMTPVTSNMYAALSQGMEMLFLAAYAVGRHSAAAMMHFTYLLALPWLVVCYGRRYAMPAAGVTAAMLIFCSPVIGIDGISAYNDVAAACQWFALFLVLRRMEEAPESQGLLVLAGVLGGFAFGMKYTLFPALLLAGAWVVWLHGRKSPRPLLTVAAAAIPFVAPWLLRNTIWWRNPLAPFFNNWFPNPYISHWFEVEYRRHMSMYSLSSWGQIPLDVTVRGEHLNGILGPVFLLAPLALLALRTGEGRRLLVAAAFALATYPSNVGTRFLIPALPFVALAMGTTFALFRWSAVALVAMHAILSWPNVIPAYSYAWAWRLEKAPWKDALRLRGEDYFIQAHNPAYALTRRLEALVPPGRRILGFSQLPEAYTNRDYLVGFQSMEGTYLRDIIQLPLAKDRQPTRQVEMRFPKGKHRAMRVVLSRDDEQVQWTLAELRIWNGEKEVLRSPLWRLRADAAPYEIQNAFDHSYVTRWMTDRARRKGMYVEVDFGVETQIDHVALHLSPDQPWDTFHIEVPDGRRWKRLETALRPQDAISMRGMRRAAVEELLRRDVNFLVIGESDFGWEDFAVNRKVWGIEQLAEAAGTRLYRLLPRAEFESQQKGGK